MKLFTKKMHLIAFIAFVMLIPRSLCDSGQWSHSDLPMEISDEDPMESSSSRLEHKTGQINREDVNFNDPNNASLYLSEAFDRLAQVLNLNSTNLNSNSSTIDDWEKITNHSMSDVSGRSARQLDLDALISGTTKQHSDGERESRIMNEEKPAVGLQGFIPVLNLAAASSLASSTESLVEQSYRKHSSFVPHFNPSKAGNRLGSTLQSLASSIAPGGKLKRKQNGQDYASFAQDCACVPFYMCKKGYLHQSQTQSVNGPVMRMHQTSSPQLYNYLNEAQTELQKLYPSMQQQQLAALLAQPEHLQQRHPIEMPNSFSQANTGSNSQSYTPPISTPNSPSYSSSNFAQSAPVYQPTSTNDANFEQHEDSTAQASSNGESELELPIDERSIDGSSQMHFNGNDTEMEMLGRMLGLGGNGKNQGCGVLRTCCPILSQSDLMAAHQAFGISPEFNHQPSMMGMLGMPSVSQMAPPMPPMGPPMPPMGPPMPPMGPPMSPIHGIYPPISPPQLQSENIKAYAPSFYPQQTGKIVNQGNSFSGHLKDTAMLGSMDTPIRPTFNSQYSSQFGPEPVRINGYQELMASSFPSLKNGNYRSSTQNKCGNRPEVFNQARVANLNYPTATTEFGEFPWQAALLKRIGPQDSLFVCGATLISDQWVATAAHCIKKNTADTLKVRFGEWDVHREDEFYPYVEKNVAEVIKHPQFYPGTLANDIALLRLESPLSMEQPHIQPACLPYMGENFAGKRCWVAGWGKNAFGQQGDYQSVLRKVDLPVVGHSQCNQILKRTRLGHNFDLHAGFMCAGGEKGKDACEGDGGSGLVCEMSPGHWKVAGLVSWGLSCGKAGIPGVYVNMAYFSHWIEHIMHSHSRSYMMTHVNHHGSVQPSSSNAYEDHGYDLQVGKMDLMDKRGGEQTRNQVFEAATLINERSNSNSTSDELVIPHNEKEELTNSTIVN